MKREWKGFRLDELGFVGRGRSRHRPRNDARLYGGPYPFIQTADIMAADPYITGYSQTYSEFGLQQSKLWPPKTLCMTIAGANTAQTAILTFEACFPDSVIGFIPDEKKADLHFVKYSLDLMKDRFRAVTRGATQDNLSLDKLLSFPIQMPPLLVQQRIAGVLSNYDDLIENNTRRIAILEEMARSLYREWFVHFRFPGHEKVKMVESRLGRIPEGWAGSFCDLVTIEREGINPFQFSGEQFEHFSIPAFDDGRQPIVERGEAIRSGKYVIDASCVLVSKLNPRIPRIWLPAPSGFHRAITSTEFLVLKPRDGVTREFVYAKCCSGEFADEFASLAIGTSTSHQRVKPNNLLTMPSIVPGQATIDRFSSLVAPMLELGNQVQTKTRNLRLTRDLLLPKLISGEIDVSRLRGEAGRELAP